MNHLLPLRMEGPNPILCKIRFVIYGFYALSMPFFNIYYVLIENSRLRALISTHQGHENENDQSQD